MLLTQALRPVELWHAAWFGADTALAIRDSQASNPRPAFDAAAVYLPAHFTDVDSAALVLARAAIAHLAAHRQWGGARFAVGNLKPIQVALVSLIEDARVEQLAMAARPGLRRLWQPFQSVHGVAAGCDIPALLRQLANALFSPDQDCQHPFVEKGRRMFWQQRARWHDPAVGRQIGSLLGNDLGQMRLQFNWKTYAVEPAYRDDNSGLWDFDEAPADFTAEVLAAGPKESIDGAPPPPSTSNTEQVRGSQQGSQALALVPSRTERWPEWDYRIGHYRPAWVEVHENMVSAGSADTMANFLKTQQRQVKQLARLLRSARGRQALRRRRQNDGDGIDVNACIAAIANRRAGLPIDARVYTATVWPQQSMALALLIDQSQSTAQRYGAQLASILETQCAAGALLCEALAMAGEPFALASFCSAGRADVRLNWVKTFATAWDQLSLQRLAGLMPNLSTRLGGALRALARHLLEQQPLQRVLLVFSDGEPADIDSPDRRYLIEDARRAVGELQEKDIQVFCFGLDPEAATDLRYIFGPGHSVLLEEPSELARYLQQFYRRLARR